MTVSTTTQKARYLGNDSTTVFAYDFPIVSEAHLVVAVADADDNATTLTLNTHYTVSGEGEADGGDVTLLDLTSICGAEILPDGWSVTINREPPLLQSTDLTNQGGFFAETHESTFDYLMMCVQYLAEQLDRAVKVSLTSGNTGEVLAEDFEELAAGTLAAKDTAIAAASAASASAASAEVSASTATDAAAYADSSTATISGLVTSAETAAGDAEAARDAVLINCWEGTGSVGQTVITITGFILDTEENNIQVYIDGERLAPSLWTRTSSTEITMDSALSGGEALQVYSATAASSTAWDGTLTDMDFDGADAIGEALADDDLLVVNNTSGPSTVVAAMSRVAAYIATKLANMFLPTGGTAGQALVKASGTDYDAAWGAVSGAPTGSVLDYAGTTAPSGWLMCYGQDVSRTTYAGLFSTIGTDYGVGDGSTTFTLPDLRGRVIAGKDDMGGSAASRLTSGGSGITATTLGATGGSETHTLTTAQLAAHGHAGATLRGQSGQYYMSSGFTGGSNTDVGLGNNNVPNSSTTSAGSSSAHQNTQPTMVLNKIIKT